MQPQRLRYFVIIAALLLMQPLAAQWIVQTSGTTQGLNDVFMIDTTTALVVGNNGVMLKTTNSGTTWVPKSAGLYNWTSIGFANAFFGVVVGYGNAAAVTTNGGETWSPVSPMLSEYSKVAFMGTELIFVASSFGSVAISADSGDQWSVLSTSQDVFDILTFVGLSEAVNYSGYVIMRTTALKTSDNGETWRDENFPVSQSAYLFAASRDPAATVYVAGFDVASNLVPLILRKSLLDTSWIRQELPSPVSGYLTDISAPGFDGIYACGITGIIWRSTDGGATWEYVPSPVLRNLRAAHFATPRRGFIVGDNGTILFTENGATSVVTDAAPLESGLITNHPNPFNTATTIEFSLQQSSPAQLQILDCTGKQVVAYPQQVFPPGKHTVEFNAHSLATGVYFARLTVGSRTLTRKMLLLR